MPKIHKLLWKGQYSNESVLHIKWPKYWSFNFNISPSKEYSGLISFSMDWLDLPAVQGTLKSLLQYHSSKTSILRCSAFFIVQLSHPYMTTGQTIALTKRTFVGKVMSLLFNILSRLGITFLPRSKRLLISWLHEFHGWLINTWNIFLTVLEVGKFKIKTLVDLVYGEAHFLVFMCVCSVTQLCSNFWDPMDCSPQGSSIHGILQARTLEWVAIPFSRGSSWSRNRTQVSCIVGRFFTLCTTREALAHL